MFFRDSLEYIYIYIYEYKHALNHKCFFFLPTQCQRRLTLGIIHSWQCSKVVAKDNEFSCALQSTLVKDTVWLYSETRVILYEYL